MNLLYKRFQILYKQWSLQYMHDTVGYRVYNAVVTVRAGGQWGSMVDFILPVLNGLIQPVKHVSRV